MCTKPCTHSCAKEINIPIVPVPAEEQTRRVDEAIAKRAYQIFEKRGGMPWHELEDWRQAEKELHANLCFTETTEDHTVVIGADPAGFAPGTLQIWVAPSRVTLSGQWHPHHPNRTSNDPCPPFHHIFRSIELPCTVVPSSGHAYIRNQYLEIKLPKAGAQTKHAGAA